MEERQNKTSKDFSTLQIFKMKYSLSFRHILSFIVFFACFLPVQAGKTVKIKLTGSIYENIVVSVGQTGRNEVISSLPYILEVSKNDLPMKLKFQSPSFIYYDIDVPQKPFDTTGHVYLVKMNETAMNLMNRNNRDGNVSNVQNLNPIQAEIIVPDNGIDINYGVNAAPVTGRKNDKTFALIISNEDYEMVSKVDNALSDGIAFKEYCLKTFGLPNENIRFCPNLTYGKMKKAISDMVDFAGIFDGEADLIIYYAGHGIPDNKTKDAFLMPVDADGRDADICFPLSGLYESLDNSNLNRCILFLDACFSGAQRGGDMIVAARGIKLKPKEVIPAGKTIVFSATSGDEAAYSHMEEKHGLFTYYLLSKFQETKGNCTLGELAEFLNKKVAVESRRINNVAQTPKVTVSPGLENNWKSIKMIK